MPLVFTRGRRRLASFLGCFLALNGLVIAAAPPLREQISLNGEWPVGGTVPVYAGLPKFDARTYERDVAVPAAWAGRIVQLEFGAVNFIARVFIDDTQVGENIGGWCPFALDVTRLAVPGRTFRLRVEVKGPKHAPIADAAGNSAWPVGGWKDRGGIADDVWLRAYGAVHITDAFIQTSVERQTLTVAYTLRNATAETRPIALAAETSGIKLSCPPVTLAAGEVKTVTLSAPAGDLALYWPDRPSLHLLLSRVVDAASGAELDRETRRFGFREITLKGNQFYWNGVRANLYGDYQVFGDTWYVDSAKLHSPQAWPATVDRIKAMNLRVLRWHHNPVPAYLLDVADEKGLLICSEAANYGRDFHQKSDRALYVTHALKTIAPWIRAERNHPSIYLWNATNEMTHSFTGPFAPPSLVPLGEEIARLDPTRPVGYDGDTGRSNPVANPDPKDLQRNRITESALVDYHYPEAYNKEPTGSIYGWANIVFPDKPTGSGEMLHTRSPLPEMQTAMERNTWWLGVWLRGLRFTDWTNVKPACWWFTDADLASDDPARRQRTLNLRNALAPVALFDKAYDDLGIAPYVTGATPGGTLPVLIAGAAERRTLIVYNDEFRDSVVTIEVTLQSGGKTLAVGRTEFTVELGSHREIPCAFRVPATAAGGELAMVLRTSKRGALHFEEVRRFLVQVSPGDLSASSDGPPAGEVVFP
ncbi:MAG: hypothetical protein H7343_05970 [Undibacterium sp.]|nr:hypothetical protein [Opitutaceae bacterium]